MKKNVTLATSKNSQAVKPERKAWLLTLLMFACMTMGLYQLWLAWPNLVIEAAHWQREANAQLADSMYETKQNSLTAGAYLAGLSFLYGVLHSLGPGHGKVIVSTYLATHPTKAKTSLAITMVSALFQALVAITLVTALLWGFSASMRMVNEKAMLFVSASFALVVLLGGLICYKACKTIVHSFRAAKPSKLTFSALSPANQRTPIGVKANPIHAPSQPSGAHCGCGHNHVAEADAINHASTWREYAAIIASIGIRPCTGAIMVLLFANAVGLYWMGVVSAVLMAVGTALTTSTIAIMTLTGKHLVKRYLATGKPLSKGWQLTGAYIQLFGGLFLIAIGLLLMSGNRYGLSPVLSI